MRNLHPFQCDTFLESVKTGLNWLKLGSENPGRKPDKKIEIRLDKQSAGLEKEEKAHVIVTMNGKNCVDNGV